MGNRWLLAVFALMVTFGLSQSSAQAQTESEGQLWGPKVHDGFYLQLTGGFGYVSSSFEGPGDQSMGGLALDTSLMIGGSPMAGLALGGGFMIDYIPSPSLSVGGNDVELTDVSQYLVGIGIFGDFYPDPHGGLHFQAFVGWGGLETSSNGNVGGSDPTGLVASIGGGYDIFIADEISVGGMLRFAYAPLSINDASVTSIAPALLGTLTYH